MRERQDMDALASSINLRRTTSPMEAWELVGNTPLLRLRNISPPSNRIELYAKAEWFNPGGSVKDRPALNMILDGERAGLLTPGKIILDATSGNTGIAYAWIGAARGYKVKLALPQNASEERKRIERQFIAEVRQNVGVRIQHDSLPAAQLETPNATDPSISQHSALTARPLEGHASVASPTLVP